MTIVNSTDLIKNINYFNRLGNDPLTVSIVNESTNVATVFDVDSFASQSYYDTLTFTTSEDYFLQDNFYFFKVLDAENNIIFQDKLFCTNQNDYSINENKYKEHTTTNEYKIYR